VLAVVVAVAPPAAADPPRSPPDDEEPPDRDGTTPAPPPADHRNPALVAVDAGAWFTFRVGATWPAGGEFGRVSSTVGLAGGFDVMYAPRSLPLAIGVVLDVGTVGGDDHPTGDRDVDYRHSMGLLAAVVRLRTRRPVVRVFGDVLVGLSQNSTRSAVTFWCRQLCSDPQLDALDGQETFGSTSFAYGAAVGVHRRLGGRVDGRRFADLSWLELRVSYLHTDRSTYVVPGTIAESNGALVYDTATSPAQVVVTSIGLGFGR